MKRLKIIMLATAFLIFCNAILSTADADTTVSYQKKAGAEREEYVVSKLKSYFQEKQHFRQLKSSDQQEPGREITLLLREAGKNYDSYNVDTQQYISRFLMRPDSIENHWPWDDEPVFYLPGTIEKFEPDIGTYPNIGGKFKFWYVTNTTADGGGVTHSSSLVFVQAMAAAFETVYSKIIINMGYPAPPDDSEISLNGEDSKMDIYVMNCGYYNVYGYTVSEGDGFSNPSFMVMDNDFAEFATQAQTAEQAMQVTAAHEYHHAVQFGINSEADAWIMEATATWMEDQVYDDIDDNLQYLNSAGGFFANPHQSIDSEFHWYNSWILLEYMETKWNQGTVKNVWLDYLATSNDGTTAVVNTIEEKGITFKSAFKEFSTVNFAQQGFYTNHLLYNPVHISNEDAGTGYNIDYSSATSNVFESGTISLSHLSTKYYKLTPGASTGTGDEDTLTVYINGYDGRQIDVVPMVTEFDNTVTQPAFSLDSSNDGTLIVENFNRSSINSVVLALVSYSTSEENSTVTLRGGIGVDGAANVAPGVVTPTPINIDSSGNGGCFMDSLR